MIRVIVVLLMLGLGLCASELAVAAKIIDKTVGSLFPDKQQLDTWVSNKYHSDILFYSKRMQRIPDPAKADFYLVDDNIPEEIPEHAIIFSTNIDLFYEDDRVIGAFYWQKGRPNLIFLRPRLEKHNLTLGAEFESYIEDEL